MSPVKKRRRLPTLINRGLGLLEVVLPQHPAEDLEGVLPPGQRDSNGFWLPKGCREPGDLFSPAQRRQQRDQRRIQRRRLRVRRRSDPDTQDREVPSEAGPGKTAAKGRRARRAVARSPGEAPPREEGDRHLLPSMADGGGANGPLTGPPIPPPGARRRGDAPPRNAARKRVRRGSEEPESAVVDSPKASE